jgi:GT2 family glycosyltransferase
MERGHEQFILLNPDAKASVEVLTELAEHVRAHPDSLVSPFMDAGDGRPHFRGSQVSLVTGQMRTSWSPGDGDPEWKNWLSGACLAFGREAVDRLGGFSEQYFLYWEDVDFSRRAAEHGLPLDLREDLLVVHDEGGTHTEQGARAKSPLYYYYNVRGRLLFGRRHLQGRAWRRWLLVTPRQSLRIWMRGGRRQLFTSPGGAWAAARGMVSGLGYAVRRPPREILSPATQSEGAGR